MSLLSNGSIIRMFVVASLLMVAKSIAAPPTTRPATTVPANPWGVKQILTGDPNQPHILCIGDSILGGYHAPLAELLRGKASLDIWITPRSIADKSLPITMKEIFAKQAYEVILFNDIGLHAWQPGRIPEGQYEPLLRAHVANLRRLAPDAKLIFATTTPMTTRTRPITLNGEFNPLIEQRNAIAIKVMEENHVPVADYYHVLVDKLDLAAGDGFHWKKPAYGLIADVAAGRIWQALGAIPQPGAVTR